MKFLLLSKAITNYTKNDIDKGLVPPQIYKLCCCIRESFCLSYSIRKNNDLYIYFIDDKIAIKFIGQELRYLGPDERSQAILLNKALLKKEENVSLNNWTNSTPGIYIKQYFDDFSIFKEFTSLDSSNTFFIAFKKHNSAQNINLSLKEDIKNFDKNSQFILPSFNVSEENPNLLKFLVKEKALNLKVIYLIKIRKMQDKIIYINNCLDNLEITFN
jgi:tRNA pseudouridine-54 N-methylase